MHNVSGTMSTKTGPARTNRTQLDDAMNENGFVITSSPSPTPNPSRMRCRALALLFTAMAHSTPRHSANLASNASSFGLQRQMIRSQGISDRLDVRRVDVGPRLRDPHSPPVKPRCALVPATRRRASSTASAFGAIPSPVGQLHHRAEDLRRRKLSFVISHRADQQQPIQRADNHGILGGRRPGRQFFPELSPVRPASAEAPLAA